MGITLLHVIAAVVVVVAAAISREVAADPGTVNIDATGFKWLTKNPMWRDNCPQVAAKCNIHLNRGARPSYDATLSGKTNAPMRILATREAFRSDRPGNKFTTVASYHPDADIDFSWGRTLKVPTSSHIMAILHRYPFEKRTCGGVWIVSNMAVDKRNKLAATLAHTLKCTHIFAKGCHRLPSDVDCRPPPPRDPEKEFEQLCTYKFYFAFENARSDYYITEKVWRSLASGLIPVVLGAPTEFMKTKLPPHSFISYDQFDSMQALADHVAKVESDKELYQSYHEWRKHYAVQYARHDLPNVLQGQREYPRFGALTPVCNLCKYVQQHKGRRFRPLSADEVAAKVGDVVSDWMQHTPPHSPHRPAQVKHVPHVSTSAAPEVAHNNTNNSSGSNSNTNGGGGREKQNEGSRGDEETGEKSRGSREESTSGDALQIPSELTVTTTTMEGMREEMNAHLSVLVQLVQAQALKINQLELQVSRLRDQLRSHNGGGGSSSSNNNNNTA